MRGRAGRVVPAGPPCEDAPARVRAGEGRHQLVRLETHHKSPTIVAPSTFACRHVLLYLITVSSPAMKKRVAPVCPRRGSHPCNFTYCRCPAALSKLQRLSLTQPVHLLRNGQYDEPVCVLGVLRKRSWWTCCDGPRPFAPTRRAGSGEKPTAVKGLDARK